MNNYITLNNKKYKTLAKDWMPIQETPATVRMTLSGKTDAAFAPSDVMEWVGTLEADNTPETGFGTITDIGTAIAGRAPVTFVDHYGTSYSVIIQGQIRKKSLLPVWDAAKNTFHVQVHLVRYVS